jgi:hypothetical protein
VRFDNRPTAANWLCHNVGTLARLDDPELRDLFAVPRGAGGYRLWGRFGRAAGGCGAEPGLASFWRAAVDAFGPLPWPAVQVVVGPLEEPLGLSFPGAVLLADRLLASPLRARWLYLAHELIHQWLGNAVRFAEGSAEAGEAWVDAVTWHLAEGCAGPAAGRAYRGVYERYQGAGGELAARGLRVVDRRQRIRAGDIDLAALCPPGRPRHRREEWTPC